MIISVAYRVKSKSGVKFRRWANGVSKEYIIDGYANPDRYTKEDIEGFCIRRFKKDTKAEVVDPFRERKVTVMPCDATSAEEEAWQIFAGLKLNMDVYKTALVRLTGKIGISKCRLKFVDYTEATNYNYNQLRYNNNWSAIITGETPHSGTAKGDYSSNIRALEAEECYPHVERVDKLTKTQFNDVLSKLID